MQLVLEDAEQSAAEDDAAKGAAEPAERRRRIEVAHRNRGALPAHLPRYEVVIDIESKECPCCGGALHLIGDDRTETEAYLQLSAERYRLLRTHEWSDEVIDRLRHRPDRR